MSELEPTRTYSNPTATDELRRLLDERGVEWWQMHDDEVGYCEDRDTEFLVYGCKHVAHELGCRLQVDMLTPEEAIAATLGPVPWVSPTWERWHKSLRHDEVKSIGDAVEQLMYEVIEFGGDMGPNGNTYNGIDEGDVLTSGFINSWVERFATLGRGTCKLVPTRDKPRSKAPTLTCSECGWWTDEIGKAWRYCPNCGRRVEP